MLGRWPSSVERSKCQPDRGRVLRTVLPFEGVIAAVLIIATAPATRAATAEQGLWTARAQTIVTQVTAYGKVEPAAVLRVRAGEDGVLTAFDVRPGDQVAPGAMLGRLAGPTVDAALATRRAELASAQAALAAARQDLAISRQNEAARLSTRDAVVKAEAAVSEAEARLTSAQAQLSAAQGVAAIKAEQPGRVLSVDAAAGERVTAGQIILVLQPTDALWLHAAVYGRDARSVRKGMTGRFTPADDGAPVPVRVSGIAASLRPDGGRTVNLVAAGASPGWVNGEAGTVTIETGTLDGVTVPTRSLILDKARWYVLVHTDKGDRAQEVTPGPSRGAFTIIEKGLAPGAAIVVDNAYLEFHRGVAARYQPPD